MKQELVNARFIGNVLRSRRKDMGYKTTKQLVAAVEEKTGYRVSKETLYNVESGKVDLKFNLYIALVLTLWPEERLALNFPFGLCIKDWQDARLKKEEYHG